MDTLEQQNLNLPKFTLSEYKNLLALISVATISVKDARQVVELLIKLETIIQMLSVEYFKEVEHKNVTK